MKKTAKKDQVAAVVCYLVAVVAAANGWFAFMTVCILFAALSDPPIRKR